MSLAEEDTELRDLLAHTLESNGTLAKLRAQLRASIFLLLDSYDNSHNNIPTIKKELKELLKTDLGRDVLLLVTDLLQFYNLEHTLAVLKPECGVDNSNIDLSNSTLKTISIQSTGDKPLLLEVLSKIEKSSLKEQPFVNPTNVDAYEVPQDLTDAQVEDAYRKFRQYDTDRNGSIDKQELRMLFQDMFPGFNRNMLERYVNDEFRSVDKNFTNSIDREEFIGVYRRLFLQCRAVVVNPLRSGSSSPRKSVAENSSSLSSRPPRSNASSTHQSSSGPARAPLSPQGSSLDEDPFFEDQPRSVGLKSTSNKFSTTTPSSTNSTSTRTSSSHPAPQSSLQDLPALNGNITHKDDNRKTLQQNRSHLDRQLGLIGDLQVDDDDVEDDDYANDDFEEDVKSGIQSARSDRSGKSEISERSGLSEISERSGRSKISEVSERSERNGRSKICEVSEQSERSEGVKQRGRGAMSYDVDIADFEIDDAVEVEEEINLSQSATDDIVTDRTVESDRSLGLDYLEDAVARRF